MAFKIGEVLNDMAAAAAKVLGSDWPKAGACLKIALRNERDALKDIAQARIDKKITNAEMREQLADEKETVKAALLTCEVIGKVAAQKAVNAAVRVLVDAIRAAV